MELNSPGVMPVAVEKTAETEVNTNSLTENIPVAETFPSDIDNNVDFDENENDDFDAHRDGRSIQIRSLNQEIIRSIQIRTTESCTNYRDKILDICKESYLSSHKIIRPRDPRRRPRLPNGNEVCFNLKKYAQCIIAPMNAVCEDSGPIIETALAETHSLATVCQTFFSRSLARGNTPRRRRRPQNRGGQRRPQNRGPQRRPQNRGRRPQRPRG